MGNFGFVVLQILSNTRFAKFGIRPLFSTCMPKVKDASVPDNPREFFGEDPEEVLRKLKSFDSSTRKLLPVSHQKVMWAQMSTIQRTKVLNAMTRKFVVVVPVFLCVVCRSQASFATLVCLSASGLSDEELARVVPGTDPRTVRQAHKPLVPSSSTSTSSLDSECPEEAVRPKRAPTTTPDDICRLIHLVNDPTNAGLLTAAYQPLSRTELDRPSSDRRDPWLEIAARFNDYDQFRYANATVEPGRDGDEPRSAAGMDVAFSTCGTWNPTNSSRPPRDAGWIRTQLSSLRKDYTRIRDKYHASGNQDAEYPVDEFSKFCQGSQYPLYAFVVWQDTRVQWFWDRRLPTEFQREEGIWDSDSEATERSEQQPSGQQRQSAKRKAGSREPTPAKRSREETAPLVTVALQEQQTRTAAAMEFYFAKLAQTTAEKYAVDARKAEIDSLNAIVSNAAIPEEVRTQAVRRLTELLEFHVSDANI